MNPVRSSDQAAQVNEQLATIEDDTLAKQMQVPIALALMLPVGLSAAGLPVAIQLVGRAWDEATLLGIAMWCESVIGFSEEPEPLVCSGFKDIRTQPHVRIAPARTTRIEN